jgi:hypothetical protein
MPIRTIRPLIGCLLAVALLLSLCPTAAYPAEAASPADCKKMRIAGAGDMRKFKLCMARFLEPIDPTRREWFGELYDPKKYVDCVTKEPMDTACDRYQLRRRPEPEYWPGGIKPVLKLPEAPKQNVYRKGMTSREYFDALCKAEAG